MIDYLFFNLLLEKMEQTKVFTYYSGGFKIP